MISGVALTLAAGMFLFAPGVSRADDRVTICHFTGSDTNPVVTVTVSVNSLPAHLAQGDVVAPAAGCDSLIGGGGGGGGGGQL